MKIICSECKKEIEDTCKQCPNCGFKNKLNTELYLKTSPNGCRPSVSSPGISI